MMQNRENTAFSPARAKEMSLGSDHDLHKMMFSESAFSLRDYEMLLDRLPVGPELMA